MTVTRSELAVHIEAAFLRGPASRDNLLAYATSSRARPEIITTIRNLPDKSYRSLRDLWNDLAELPVNS